MLETAMEQIHRIFNNEMPRSLLLKLRHTIFIICFILLIPRIRPSLFWPGFLVSLFGALIQFWCFASLEKNKTLAVKGPYMITRNPMYLGRFFLLLGCLILTANILFMIAFTALYYFYMFNRVKREEKKLHAVFGQAYEEYSGRVNRFLPSFRGLDWNAFWFFKTKLLMENHGHWNLLICLCCYGIFYSRVMAETGHLHVI